MATGAAVAGSDLVNASADFLAQVGRLGSWLQALGMVVILWLFFEIVAFLINRKRMKEIYAIKEDVVRIEKKIDDILKRIK